MVIKYKIICNCIYQYEDCKLFKVLVSLIDKKKNEDNYFNVNTEYKRAVNIFSLNEMLCEFSYIISKFFVKRV